MTKDELLKRAQVFIDYHAKHWNGLEMSPQELSDAIREALAQPEQEPVAWITKNGKGWLRWHRPEDNEKNKDSIPLYTTPPHRKPLTDEEIGRIAGDCLDAWSCARAIEAAHGIKE